MPHFAKINDQNIVENVIVIENRILADKPFPRSERPGQNFIRLYLRLDGEWLQTSYNNNFRGNYAGIGMRYMPEYDIFISEQPYPSWTLNPSQAVWEPPVPYPDDYGTVPYDWDEDNLRWVEAT